MKSLSGDTALVWTRKNGRFSCEEILESHGAISRASSAGSYGKISRTQSAASTKNDQWEITARKTNKYPLIPTILTYRFFFLVWTYPNDARPIRHGRASPPRANHDFIFMLYTFMWLSIWELIHAQKYCLYKPVAIAPAHIWTHAHSDRETEVWYEPLNRIRVSLCYSRHRYGWQRDAYSTRDSRIWLSLNRIRGRIAWG